MLREGGWGETAEGVKVLACVYCVSRPLFGLGLKSPCVSVSACCVQGSLIFCIATDDLAWPNLIHMEIKCSQAALI